MQPKPSAVEIFSRTRATESERSRIRTPRSRSRMQPKPNETETERRKLTQPKPNAAETERSQAERAQPNPNAAEIAFNGREKKCLRPGTLWSHRIPGVLLVLYKCGSSTAQKNDGAPPRTQKHSLPQQHTLPPFYPANSLPHRAKQSEFLSILQSQKTNSKTRPKSHRRPFSHAKVGAINPENDLSRTGRVSLGSRRINAT